MCGKPIQVFVPRGFDYKEITVACGSTSPSGFPFLCLKCEELHKDRDWKKEAFENGERWDDDY